MLHYVTASSAYGGSMSSADGSFPPSSHPSSPLLGRAPAASSAASKPRGPRSKRASSVQPLPLPHPSTASSGMPFSSSLKWNFAKNTKNIDIYVSFSKVVIMFSLLMLTIVNDKKCVPLTKYQFALNAFWCKYDSKHL